MTETVFEMTLDRASFLRLLPAAVDGAPFQEEDGFVHREPGRLWRIRLSPLPPIRLGPFPMARLRVAVGLEGYSAEAELEFINTFRTHFLRGGG